MRKVLLLSLAVLPLAACGGLSVGVGVGGGSGNVGVGASASVDVGNNTPAGSSSRVTVTMYKIDDKGIGPEIGTLSLMDTRGGLEVVPKLRGLPPGERGFHVHENPNCGPAMKDGKMVAGLAAGNHYDPNATGKHEGPKGDGHRGDLPVLVVDKDGNATERMLAFRLQVSAVRGRAFVIHEGGDNFADQPKPLGGGGARIACGVVSQQWDEAQ
jgi:Cu-Zn family superoxide dismutase